MFVGAINAAVRQFLGNCALDFSGAKVIVGCSGNFTMETVLTHCGAPAEIHSNDVSLYTCMAGRWLTGEPVDFTVKDADYLWLQKYTTPIERVAAILVLLDMLEHDKRDTQHRRRMWQNFRQAFDLLVLGTIEKLEKVQVRVTSFYAGDVMEHFKRFEDDPEAIFAAFCPTYSGGYERLYKRLDAVIGWDPPTYSLLDDDARANLLTWMRERKFLWYDDRQHLDMVPVMRQQGSLRARPVYLYSNTIGKTAFLRGNAPKPLPKYKLAGESFQITPESTIRLVRIKTGEIASYKDAFLAKNIMFGSGMWGFAVQIDGKVVGFIEYSPENSLRGGLPDSVYLFADFSVPGTRYTRLSKLIVMLTVAGETRRLLECARQIRQRKLITTAFTERAVSMKYRGVLTLTKRGEDKDGKKFLQYEGVFNDLSWQQTLEKWRGAHGK